MSHASLLAAIESLPGKGKPGGGRRARCPVHDDRKPSLSIDIGDEGQVLMHCMAGCRTEDIVAALGGTMTDLFPETSRVEPIVILPSPDRKPAAPGTRRFEARLPDGTIVGHHCRRDDGAGNKAIWWDPTGVSPRDLALFLSWDLKPGRVVVVEGERTTIAVRAAGIQAVGTYGAGHHPSAAALEVLRDRSVTLWPDNDPSGRKHMEELAESLVGVAADIAVVQVPDSYPKGWDAADASATTIADLVAIARPRPTVRLRFMDTYEAIPMDWLWEGWLPKGAVTLFDGNPGEAKSTMVMSLIARITTGNCWPDGTTGCKPSRVLIITREDDPERVLAPRLAVAGADLSRVAFLDDEFVMPTDEPKLRAAIAAVPDVALVFIDPLFSHIDGSVKTISDNDIRKAVMTPLSELANDANVAILAMRHNSKDTTKSALMRGAGSFGGLVGAARAVWAATSDPDDESGAAKLFGVVKSNYAQKPPTLRYEVYGATPPGAVWVGKTVSAVRWLGTSSLSIDDVMTEEDHEGARTATELLVTYLEGEGGQAPASSTQAYLRSKGHGSASIKAAKKRAGIRSEKAGFGGGWSWRLPDPDTKESKESEPTSSTSSAKESEEVGPPIRATSSTPSTSSTPWEGGHEEVEEVEEVEVDGPSPRTRTHAREGRCRVCSRSVELDTVGSVKPHYAEGELHAAKWNTPPCLGSAKRPLEETA